MRHRVALVDYAAPIIGCRVRAEDVAQEAYLRFAALTHRHQSERSEIAQPVGYLYRIVRNLAVDWVRRLSAERSQDQAGGALGCGDAAAPSAEHAALCREQLCLLTQALAELPERVRRAFELHHVSGLTLQEISSELGISITLAHQLIRQAMNHCARRLST